MREAVIVSFGGEEIVARELSTFEVASLFEKIRQGRFEMHSIDMLMDFNIPFEVVLTSTGKSEDFFINKNVTPTALVSVYEAVTKANPGFAAMAARLVAQSPVQGEEKKEGETPSMRPPVRS